MLKNRTVAYALFGAIFFVSILAGFYPANQPQGNNEIFNIGDLA